VVGRQGSEELVFATDEVVAALDELQFTLGEGPCIDAASTRLPVLVSDLEGSAAFDRWPGFAHEATQVGARAAFAFLLQIGAVPFGVIEFYRRRRGPLAGELLAEALLLVDELVLVVLRDLTGGGHFGAGDGSLMASPSLLFGRPEISQATGMISVQLGTSIPDAVAQLRAHAFTQRRSIAEVAADVVARRFTFANTR